MKRSALAGLAALALVALAGGGCAPSSPPLARVGDRTITVAEFEEVANRAAPAYPALPDTAKRLLLEDMIKRELLLEAAAKEPYGQAREMAAARAKVEDQMLSSVLIEQLIPRDVPVSEGEIRELLARRRTEAHVQVIATRDESRARAARAEIARGTDFGQAARIYNTPGMLPQDGDLGFIAAGVLPPPLENWLTDARPGVVQGPSRAADGTWYIARVLSRRPRAEESLEAARAELADLLRQRKRRALAARAYQKLKEASELRLDPEGPRLLFARFNAPPELDSMPDTQDPTIVLARYTDATGRERTYKMRDALDDLAVGTQRPNTAVLPSVEQWIESRAMQQVLLIEARRRALDQDPEVAKRVRDQVEQQVLEQVYQDRVAGSATPTDADRNAAFARQAGMLARLRAVKVQYFTLPDSASAVAALQRAGGSPTLKDAILLTSPRLQVVERVITFPTSDPEWAPLEPGLSHMPEGAYGGPVQVPGGWRIIQLLSAERTMPTLETLAPDARQAIEMDALNLARERRLSQVTDSLRRALPVTIDERRLARVAWPTAALGAPAG